MDRLLIANRGEIAVRIARTARRLGLGTVGVYAEPDAGALHTDVVDIAVALGGSTASESYLLGAKIIEAAHRTGSDAIHPGYGFLSENADFARAVISAGLTWVGPTPEQIALLGNKIAAKQSAAEAGVPSSPVIVVSSGALPHDVGMPALVKAAAGGGGRGMRVVWKREHLAAACEGAAREAAAAFGDDTLFIEPYMQSARHIEVQIIGDQHGNLLHLGERECSIQRRNQKIVEESPSPGIDDHTRARLYDGAVALAKHVGYESAGTVEFLVGDGIVQFLEVNTRLQVEHPVTEAVTGLDLVELQLRVAQGRPLGLSQSDVRLEGHAIEVRVVAEDPSQGWLPSTGQLTSFAVDPAARVDAGVHTDSTITPEFDSLIAKVICHGPTRLDARRQLARALRSSQITGVATNVTSLVSILEEHDFIAGATLTSYLEDHPAVLTARSASAEEEVGMLLAAVFAAEWRDRRTAPVAAFAPSGWRNLRTQGQREVWLSETGEERPVEYTIVGHTAQVLLGPWPQPEDDGRLPPDARVGMQVRLLRRRADQQVLEVDGLRHVVDVRFDGSRALTRTAIGSSSWFRAPRFDPRDAEALSAGPVSPLPGTVIAIHVQPRDAVSDGDLLVVIEAMKTEHRICAVGDGIVTEVCCAVGGRVDAGDLLVVMHQEEAAG